MMAGAESLAGTNDNRRSGNSFGVVPWRDDQKALADWKRLEALLPHRGPARILDSGQSCDRTCGDHSALLQRTDNPPERSITQFVEVSMDARAPLQLG